MTGGGATELAALCAQVSRRLDRALRSATTPGSDPVARVIAWVHGWPFGYDPDTDEGDRVAGLPLDADVTALLHRSSICQDVRPSASEYDEVVVLGAAATGMWRRLVLVDETGVHAPMLTLLAGRRPHLGRAGDGRDGHLDELLGSEGRFPAARGWRPPDRLASPVDVAGSGPDRWTVAAQRFPDETALALLLLDRRWPSAREGAVTRSTRLSDGRTVVGDVTCDADGYLERAGVAGRFERVRVLDCPSVARPNGSDRPTSRSTISTWSERDRRPVSGSRRRILLVSGQPHLARVGRIVAELAVARRLAADVEVVGPAAAAHVRGAVVLRELVHGATAHPLARGA